MKEQKDKKEGKNFKKTNGKEGQTQERLMSLFVVFMNGEMKFTCSVVS